MANAVLWDARPSAETVMATTSVAPNGLRDADASEILVAAADVANGTDLKTHADFLLYLLDFDDHPHAGDYVELHIIYEFGTLYGDGEDGDVAAPTTIRLSGATFAGLFPIYGTAAAGDENQHIQLCGIPIGPHDFRVVLKFMCSHNLADSDGSFLQIFRYSLEVQ